MAGCDIYVYDEKTFEVWTNQVGLSRKLAKEHSLVVELLDGEAIVYVPTNLADTLLPRFGAKVKRTLSDKQRAVLAQNSKKYRFGNKTP